MKRRVEGEFAVPIIRGSQSAIYREEISVPATSTDAVDVYEGSEHQFWRWSYDTFGYNDPVSSQLYLITFDLPPSSQPSTSVYVDFSDVWGVADISGSTFGDVLRGGSEADMLDGREGDDRLDGGLGADTMWGGAGNDILMGTADLSGSGNALDNLLQGNSGANTLSGGAGNDRLDGRGGADTLIGGTGNDIYYIDDLGDVMVEEAGEGYDTAMLGVDGYVLADGVSVERLILRDGVTTATGNDLDNVLQGNGGDNVLFGGGGRDTLRGGAGNDTLIGGAGIDNLYGGTGADTFVLSATTPDRDMIRDFVAAEDMLQISASLFGGGLVAGDELTPEQFVLSTTGRATSATDRFLYVESKGHLYYDADGSGRDEAPQLIAVLTTNPTLTAAHFDIVI
ncbi:calcium-binding protein [Enterovirga rhinocerotis]|nr:calcium-binding protein [Enterovirga rhinocerotis]